MAKINTLNESSLHKTLKILYAENNNGKTEVELDGKIYDLVTEKGDVIEIQTQNLEKLLGKAQEVIKQKHNFTAVFPLVTKKTIETYAQDGTLISTTRSPKRQTIYNLFAEITGLHPILLKKNFTLEVVECSVREIRVQTEKSEQSRNSRRRFKKNWQKTDKILEEIQHTWKFKTAKNYMALLPQTLEENFTTRDISNEIKKDKGLPKSAAEQANVMCWVLLRLGLIEEIGKKGNARVFKKATKNRAAVGQPISTK